MVIRTLIIVLLCLPLMSLKGCPGSTAMQDSLDAARTAEALARKSEPRETPPECIAKMQQARLRRGEAVVLYEQRWIMLAENRDRLAETCGKILAAREGQGAQ